MTQLTKTVIEFFRRVSVLGIVLFICLPAVNAFAASNELSGFLRSGGAVCLDGGGQGRALMTPDARAFQMSIELARLREMLTEREQSAEATSAPCAVEEDGEGLCELVLEASPEADADDAPRFVPASLLEDIAPLLPVAPADYSCSSSSSGPDRCESYPPLPEQISIDVSLAGAYMRDVTSTSRPRAYSITRALDAIQGDLLGASSEHVRALEEPPRG